MRKRIYKEVNDELERRRFNAMLLADKRKEEIYSKVPQVAVIDNEIRKLGIRLGLGAINGSGRQDVIKQKLNEAISRKKALISGSGYPEDYLENVHTCMYCKDTGYIKSEAGSSRCSCFRSLLIKSLLKDSNVTPAGGTFDDYNLDLYPDEPDEKTKVSPREIQARNLERCKEFVRNFHTKQTDNLIFVGKAGLGKTFMCNCIAIALIEKGIPVVYMSAPDLFDNIASKYSQDEEEREKALELDELLTNAELLIIDDLGTERQTGSRYAELLDILNSRELMSRKRICKTIISTNLSLKNIFSAYGERVASRIIGGFELLEFVGDDIRIKLRNLSY
ncbi:MAG: ATP-binding protein [Clostridiaceae bacterium]|nr:ATP-binding protein [Clostridiaceae bacterium]